MSGKLIIAKIKLFIKINIFGNTALFEKTNLLSGLKLDKAAHMEIATALTLNLPLRLRNDDEKEERPQNKFKALPFKTDKFRLD